MKLYLILVLLIPFLGTCLGSATALFMREEMNRRLEKLLLGFAAGVMVAASVWSLLVPAMEMSGEKGVYGEGSLLSYASWLPAAIGFLMGIAFLLLLDSLIPHLHHHSDTPEGVRSGFSRTAMLMLAVTLHNLPEGMAVGVSFAGASFGDAGISFAAVLSLSVGIAIQNFPEGAIISMPLRGSGVSRAKAFIYGVLSGVVEPLGAVVTILLAEQFIAVLPYLLSFAAGAMFYVVVEELIPESQSGRHSNLGTIGAAAGFALMMALDSALA